jgi:hypothetical protein
MELEARNVPPDLSQDCGIARRCKLFLGAELEQGARIQDDLFVGPPMERRRESAGPNLQAESYLGLQRVSKRSTVRSWSVGLVPINALVLTGLATFGVVGYTEVIPKRRSRKLTIRSYIEAAAVGCQKNAPLRCLQIADSTGVRFEGIGAHKQTQLFSERGPACGVLMRSPRRSRIRDIVGSRRTFPAHPRGTPKGGSYHAHQ